jgi:hypothetical protein
LAADLGIIYLMLILQTNRMQELQGHGGFHQISKESFRGQAMCGTVRIPAAVPEEVMYKVVRMKTKIQWRLQEVMDARNMDYLRRSPQETSGTSPRQRLCGMQLERT